MTICGSSIQACATRVTRIAADGTPLVGAHDAYVTDALVKLDVTTEVSVGDDFEQKNSCGAVCATYKDCDRIKRLGFTMQVCTVDPELVEILVGGALLTSAGATRGYAIPRVGLAACPNGVGLEVWTKNIVNGSPHPVYPFLWWLFPRTFWQLGPRAFENAIQIPELVGFANENSNWGTGPGGDWAWASASLMQYVFDANAPVPVCGTQTTPLAS